MHVLFSVYDVHSRDNVGENWMLVCSAYLCHQARVSFLRHLSTHIPHSPFYTRIDAGISQIFPHTRGRIIRVLCDGDKRKFPDTSVACTDSERVIVPLDAFVIRYFSFVFWLYYRCVSLPNTQRAEH